MTCMHEDATPVYAYIRPNRKVLAGDVVLCVNDGKPVAHLCPACDEQLPANHGCQACEWTTVDQDRLLFQTVADTITICTRPCKEHA